MDSFNENDTREYARTLAANTSVGDIICLDGDLGVGKTVFAKGFAEGLGIDEPVVSPTFTIIHEYHSGRLPLYHFDVYRIEEPEEMDELGYEEYFFGDGVCLIEWASQVPEIIPENAKHVLITKDISKGTEYRRIELS